MKQKIVRHIVLVGSVFILPQALFSDVISAEETIKKETVKELKVEEGATKIGEVKEKTRGLIMDLGQGSQLDQAANLNIGKIEFYVK